LGDEGFDSIVEDAGKSFGFDSTEWLVSYRSRVREVFLIFGKMLFVFSKIFSRTPDTPKKPLYYRVYRLSLQKGRPIYRIKTVARP